MSSGLLKALSLVALFALAGCETYPSQVEKRFYKECAMTPPQAPCGHY